MTPSQIKLLGLLKSLKGFPATAEMIISAGCSCASLPKLIEMNLVKKTIWGIEGKEIFVWLFITDTHRINQNQTRH